MLSNLKLYPVLGAVLPTFFFTSRVAAEILPPDGIVDNFGTTLQQAPGLGGTVEANQTIPFSLTDDQGKTFYTGQVLHEVVRDPSTNTLSFYYRFQNTPANAILGIEDFTAADFTGFSTDVNILTDSGGQTAPIDAIRTNDGAGIIFDFDSDSSRITPSGESFTFLVKTNATHFDNNGSAAISAFTASNVNDGSTPLTDGNANITTFRPTSGSPGNPNGPGSVAVPLPPSVWLAIPTMILAAIYSKRERKGAGPN
ncbi:MAG TPA: hypothetical protein VHS31_05805 [Tepidisphaeraceae bacterium]|jgi:hypothetical protein|nr:hypothetical protein [Tepidisphaeraceae bacterium]